MTERDEEIQSLNASLEQAQIDIVAQVTEVATLKEKLKNTTEGGVTNVQQTTDHLQGTCVSLVELIFKLFFKRIVSLTGFKNALLYLQIRLRK